MWTSKHTTMLVVALGVMAYIVIPSSPPLIHTANALSNPLTGGANYSIKAPNNTPRLITANGANCAVTIQVDINPHDGGASPTTQVCSGYNSTARPLTKWNCMMPVCTDTTPGKCVSTWVVRDTAPGALSVMAIDAPTDAGVPIRIELGTGCVTP